MSVSISFCCSISPEYCLGYTNDRRQVQLFHEGENGASVG